MRALRLKTDRPVVILCPGAEYGPAKRWPPNQFAELAAMFLRDGLQVWIVGSPNDRIAADAVLNSLGDNVHKVRDLTGAHRPRHRDRHPVVGVARRVATTRASCTRPRRSACRWWRCSARRRPPTRRRCRRSRRSRKIDIACSPCFKRECPLGHFKCMRELKPPIVYNLARTALPAYIPPDLRRY